jgi:Leucine-rich repeat (LRR) protein
MSFVLRARQFALYTLTSALCLAGCGGRVSETGEEGSDKVQGPAKPTSEAPGPVADQDSNPGAPETLVVHDIAELRSYSNLDRVRALDLALSLVDARTSPLPEGVAMPNSDRCEGLDLAQIAESMPNLEDLRISGCQAAVHAGLHTFAGIKRLELADLAFDDLTIARVAELHGLRSLTLLRVEATQASTLPIVRKLELHELAMRELDPDSPIGDLLGDLPSLRVVHLEGEWAAHRAMLSLGKAKQLRRLELVDTSIGNFSLNQVKLLTELREVHWVGETFTDNSPLYLRDLPVQSFYCECPKLGDGGLKHMRYLPALRELQLERSRATSAGLEALAQSEHLERAVIGDLELEDRAFVGLAKLQHLVELNLDGGVLLEPELPTLSELRGLRKLSLRVEGLTDETPEALRELGELRELSLANTQVSDGALEALAVLTKLESLELQGTRITNQGLEHLASMHNLRRLTLDHTDLVDAGVARLAPLHALEELRLDHTLVTDACLDTLMSLPKLRHLNLSHTVISREGAARLRAWGQLERLGLSGTRADEP